MKRVIFITGLLLILFSNVSNARSIRDFFVNEPHDLFALIDASTRLDLLDYYDTGRIVSSQNNLGDDTQFIKVTDDFLSIQLSESSEVEMRLLFPSKNDTIIVVNSTIKSPVEDSKLEFFDTNWNTLDTKKFITLPLIKSFISIPKEDKTPQNYILDAIDFPLISYSINPENASITASQNMEKYMSKEEYMKIAKYLIPTITYNFEGKKYKLAK